MSTYMCRHESEGATLQSAFPDPVQLHDIAWK
jgi:hypothetical protein